MKTKSTRKFWTRGFVLVTAAASICLTISGCGPGKNSSKSGGKVTYWTPMSSVAATLASNWGELPLYQELQKRTGVEVEFIHPPVGSENEQFALLLASETLPDIVEFNWAGNYSGGPGRAISDHVIIDLNKHADKFPNLMKYLDENEEARKNVYTNDGELFSAPFIRGDKSLCVSLGMTLRKDWLDELKLDVPETIDEWENVLTQFKEVKGASAPLNINLNSLRYGLFSGAYNTCYGYYLRDGKVTHGILDPGFKELLVTLNRWYKNGLLDADFATINASKLDSNILNGETGAMQLSLGGGIGKYLSVTDDPKFDLVGAPSPVLKKGDYPEFGFSQTQTPTDMYSCFTAITTDCKNIDAAAKLLDYGYSEEGHMLYNFGIEDKSYEMIDGYPTYTKEITNNPKGYAMNVAMAQYCWAYDAGPFVQDKRYMEQYAARPQQQAAWDIWTKSNMNKHLLPNLFVSGKDQNELASINTALSSYMNEQVTKLIMGTESIDNYDKILKELENRGLSRVIKIRQKAYEEYLQR